MSQEETHFDLSFKFEVKITGREFISTDGDEVIVITEAISFNDEAPQGRWQDSPANVVTRTATELQMNYFAEHLKEQMLTAFRMLQSEAAGFYERILGFPPELNGKPINDNLYRERALRMKKLAEKRLSEDIKQFERRTKKRLTEAFKAYLRQRYAAIKDSVDKLSRLYKSDLKAFKKQKPKNTSEEQWRQSWKQYAREQGACHHDDLFELLFKGEPAAKIAYHLLGLELGYEPGTVANELKPARSKQRNQGTKSV